MCVPLLASTARLTHRHVVRVIYVNPHNHSCLCMQVVIDQVFWAPIFTLIFFTWIGITSGNSPSEIVAKVKSDLIQGVVGSWTVWPLAHTINFKFVPTEQRLLYINSIQIFYNVFLSIIGSK